MEKHKCIGYQKLGLSKYVQFLYVFIRSIQRILLQNSRTFANMYSNVSIGIWK